MASAGCSAFSADGQYWANCGHDGKLKIWETATNRLKQEYVPNLHLSSSCSVIEWIIVGQQASATPAPWKKQKRKFVVDDAEQMHVVAMGSTNGSVTLYDVASAKVSKVLENGHSSTVTAIAWSALSGLFTVADDHHIVEWNIEANGVKSKWKSGKNKVTALAVTPEGNSILSADRIIKWWDLATKRIVATFTGHASQVAFLRTVRANDETSYLLSGASGESYLSIWSLDEESKDRNAVGTLTMQDEALSVSVKMIDESHIAILAANRSGQAQLFRYQPKVPTSKPIKPSLNVIIAPDSQESFLQIPIHAAQLTDDAKLLLAYGNTLNLTFERVTPDFSDNVQCLVRADIKRTKERTEEALTKQKFPDTDGGVEYSESTPVTLKRSRGGAAGSQLTLKERLDNLSLNTETGTTGRTPSKGANRAQLLMQGLNSNDKTILMNVLYSKDENVIKNSLAKLPVWALKPLMKELTDMHQRHSFSNHIALKWLNAVYITRANYLISATDIGDIVDPFSDQFIQKMPLLPGISTFRGRMRLYDGLISVSHEKDDKDIKEESLLVYQDRDSSEEDSDVGEVAIESESDENSEEMSEQGEDQEELENGKSDDDDYDEDASMSS